MSDEELLTVKQSAEKLKVSESAIRNATLEGRLPYVIKYGRKLIKPADLQAYADRTQPEGEKSKGRPAGTRKKESGEQGAK